MIRELKLEPEKILLIPKQMLLGKGPKIYSASELRLRKIVENQKEKINPLMGFVFVGVCKIQFPRYFHNISFESKRHL